MEQPESKVFCPQYKCASPVIYWQMDLGDNRFLNWIFYLRNGLWCALRSDCNNHTSQFVHIHYPDYIIHQSAGQLSDEPASWGGRLNGCFLAQPWLVRQGESFPASGRMHLTLYSISTLVFSLSATCIECLYSPPAVVAWFCWPHSCHVQAISEIHRYLMCADRFLQAVPPSSLLPDSCLPPTALPFLHFYLTFTILRVEPRSFCLPKKCSTTVLHPSSISVFP